MPEQKTFTSRFKHAWNAFFSRDPTKIDEYEDYRNDPYYGYYYGSHYRPDRPYLSTTSERTVVAAIYNRIAMDVAAIDIVHARLDDDERYIETIKSPLNNCLTVEANLDQTGRAFIQDVAMSMLDEGSVAIVPVDTSTNPLKTGSYDIYTMRTGKVTEWRPKTVRVDVYNELSGRREEILLPKEMVSIIENPLYAVMNEPNSTLQRLLRKLRLLDFVDEQQASNKLNLIIQLPYVIKTPGRQRQAENRSKAIEEQLTKSQYGIAYTDGTERITQLNRPIENNLQGQVEYLTKLLYSQLGLTEEIMNGSADDKAMINYYSRTIEPIVSAITDEMKRKFLTKTARTQGQTITFFRDPFRLVPISEIADIADRFTRNEILSSNEVRQIIGRKPSNDPTADELRNKNLYPVDTDGDGVPEYYQDQTTGEQVDEAGNPIQNDDGLDDEEVEQLLDSITPEIESLDEDYLATLDDLDSELDELEEMLKHYVSPYYDPVKAHEYYMKNRKLKGRKSTSGLNDTGKAASSYVKKQINTERDKKIESSKKRRDTNINANIKTAESKLKTLKNKKVSDLDNISKSLKADIEKHTAQTQSKIERLREMLKGMTKIEKSQNKESIYAEIKNLRDANKLKKEDLRGSAKAKKDTKSKQYKNDTTSVKTYRSDSNKSERNTHKQNVKTYRAEAENKYLNELSKIKSDKRMLKTKKK